MAAVTVQQVLEHAARFEHMLVDYYIRLAEHTTREGVRMLSDYMARHRERLSEALEKLSPGEYERIRSVPLRFEPAEADAHSFDRMHLPPGATAAEVLDTAVALDECLIRFYRQVLQQDVEAPVRDLFVSLVAAEQRDEVELKKIKAMDYF